jgi:hypothetical protein
VTFFGSEMQSGALETTTEHQKHRSKTQYKSATNSKHKCAPVCPIDAKFGINKQLASCRVTITGSDVQSGALETRTENQKQPSK